MTLPRRARVAVAVECLAAALGLPPGLDLVTIRPSGEAGIVTLELEGAALPVAPAVEYDTPPFVDLEYEAVKPKRGTRIARLRRIVGPHAHVEVEP